jgi:hypothetical protein
MSTSRVSRMGLPLSRVSSTANSRACFCSARASAYSMARAAMAAQRLPGGQRRLGGLHRLVDLRRRACATCASTLAGGRVQAVEVARAAHPAPADEVAEAAAVAFQPGLGLTASDSGAGP